ncbi:thiolase [Gottschalkiaceae bacterium SANA]|nr:thiolase [Gottschalkiaceae bacterium SANA]
MSKGKVAIIGVGNVPCGYYPERSALEGAIYASVGAIKDAGINKDDIDLCLTTSVLADPGGLTVELATGRMVEELGLKNCNNNFQVFSGGSSSTNCIKVAEGMIAAGTASMVLCVHTDKLGSGFDHLGIDVQQIFTTAGFSPEWEQPFGMSMHAITTMGLNRYVYESNGKVTDEQLASVAVSDRKWAEMNPMAAYRDPITVEDVLNSGKLPSGMNKLEIANFLDGSNAFIVTSVDLAEKLVDKPVYVWGSGSVVDHCLIASSDDCFRQNNREASTKAFNEAGLVIDDLDFASIYDFTTSAQVYGFEEVCFLETGDGPAFFAEGHGAPGGKFPVTTNGGMLSEGHTGAGGGYATLVETIRQLMGKAGERQIPNCKKGLYNTSGGTGGDSNVTIFGTDRPE